MSRPRITLSGSPGVSRRAASSVTSGRIGTAFDHDLARGVVARHQRPEQQPLDLARGVVAPAVDDARAGLSIEDDPCLVQRVEAPAVLFGYVRLDRVAIEVDLDPARIEALHDVDPADRAADDVSEVRAERCLRVRRVIKRLL